MAEPKRNEEAAEMQDRFEQGYFDIDNAIAEIDACLQDHPYSVWQPWFVGWFTWAACRGEMI